MILALAAGIYLAVYAPLAKGNLDAAKRGALAASVAMLIFLLFTQLYPPYGTDVYVAIAAACMGLAWISMKR
jgi:hypothetical protein